ncbi:MAG TPA: hypothetical protein VH062_27420 [Polyangiaceae bacterium]|jgi:hypothetical protein|nr:hypothetical protein [Polyangiaceae bacterium]
MLTVAGATVVTPAHADPSSADRTLAAALFREAKTLMDRSDYTGACAKLEESQRLDPGGGTLLNLALCHEKQGKPATAWGEFIEARGIARRDNRQTRIELADEHITKLEPTLSKIVVVVPPESDEPSLEITRDGAVIGRAAWGLAVPVDPGEHQLQAVATNKLAFHSVVMVDANAPSATLTVRIPPLARDVAAAEGTAVAGLSAAPAITGTSAEAAAALGGGLQGRPVSVPAGPAPEPEHSSAQRVWGWSAVGLGGAGIVTGTALTVVALSKKNDSHDRCAHDPCDAEAVSLSKDAGRFADFATVGFGVGAAALAAGVILLLTDHPSSSRPAAASRTWVIYPQAGAGLAAMGVRGQF